jgi:hypothetical protein
MLKTNKYINYSDIISYSWNTVISNVGLFIKIGLIYIAMYVLLAGAQFYIVHVMTAKEGQVVASAASVILSIIQNAVGIVVAIGFVRVILSLLDGVRPSPWLLLNPWGCLWRYAVASFLYGLVVAVGFMLFIVPGVIGAVKFNLYTFFVIDKGLRPVDSLKASSMTLGCMKWHWFGLMAISSMIAIAGVFCLGVGVIISYPVAFTAMALGYRQLAAQTPELENFGIKTMF